MSSHASVHLCPVFYLKTYLHWAEIFRKKSDGSQVLSLVLGNNRHQMPVCTKMISFLVKKVFCVVKAHISLASLQGAAASAGVFLVSVLQAGFLQLTGFQHISLLQIGIWIQCTVQSWASVNS